MNRLSTSSRWLAVAWVLSIAGLLFAADLASVAYADSRGRPERGSGDSDSADSADSDDSDDSDSNDSDSADSDSDDSDSADSDAGICEPDDEQQFRRAGRRIDRKLDGARSTLPASIALGAPVFLPQQLNAALLGNVSVLNHVGGVLFLYAYVQPGVSVDHAYADFVGGATAAGGGMTQMTQILFGAERDTLHRVATMEIVEVVSGDLAFDVKTPAEIVFDPALIGPGIGLSNRVLYATPVDLGPSIEITLANAPSLAEFADAMLGAISVIAAQPDAVQYLADPLFLVGRWQLDLCINTGSCDCYYNGSRWAGVKNPGCECRLPRRLGGAPCSYGCGDL